MWEFDVIVSKSSCPWYFCSNYPSIDIFRCQWYSDPTQGKALLSKIFVHIERGDELITENNSASGLLLSLQQPYYHSKEMNLICRAQLWNLFSTWPWETPFSPLSVSLFNVNVCWVSFITFHWIEVKREAQHHKHIGLLRENCKLKKKGTGLE